MVLVRIGKKFWKVYGVNFTSEYEERKFTVWVLSFRRILEKDLGNKVSFSSQNT